MDMVEYQFFSGWDSSRILGKIQAYCKKYPDELRKNTLFFTSDKKFGQKIRKALMDVSFPVNYSDKFISAKDMRDLVRKEVIPGRGEFFVCDFSEATSSDELFMFLSDVQLLTYQESERGFVLPTFYVILPLDKQIMDRAHGPESGRLSGSFYYQEIVQ